VRRYLALARTLEQDVIDHVSSDARTIELSLGCPPVSVSVNAAKRGESLARDEPRARLGSAEPPCI
jgi:hypothetical protein